MRSVSRVLVVALSFVALTRLGCTGDEPASPIILGGSDGAAPPPNNPASGDGSVANPVTDGSTPNGSCEAPLTACEDGCKAIQGDDPANCGGCGRSCSGATCTAGKCAVQKVADVDDGVDLAVGGANVFVRTASGLYTAPKEGAPTQPVHAFPQVSWSFSCGPRVDALNFYFVGRNPQGDHRLFKRPISTLADPTIIGDYATNLDCGIELTATHAVFFDPYKVSLCELPGCASDVFTAPGGGIGGAALTATAMAWTDSTSNGKIRRCLLPNCTGTVETLYEKVSDTNPTLVVIHENVAFWIDNYTGDQAVKARIHSCPLGGCDANPKTVVRGETELLGLAVDASGVYFSVAGDQDNPTGAIKVCRNFAAGCAASSELLAEKEAQPGKLAIDATHVYWINKGTPGSTPVVKGSIKRVVK